MNRKHMRQANKQRVDEYIQCGMRRRQKYEIVFAASFDSRDEALQARKHVRNAFPSMTCAVSAGCTTERETFDLVLFDHVYMDIDKITDMEEVMRTAASLYRGEFKSWKITLEEEMQSDSGMSRKHIDRENAGILNSILMGKSDDERKFEVDFTASFPSAECAAKAMELLEHHVQETCELSHGDGSHICTLRLSMRPDLARIGDIEEAFRLSAEKFGGIFLGWGILDDLQ